MSTEVSIDNNNTIIMKQDGIDAQWPLPKQIPLSPENIDRITSSIKSGIAALPPGQVTVEKMREIARGVINLEATKKNPEEVNALKIQGYNSNLAQVDPPFVNPDDMLAYSQTTPYNPNTDYDPNNQVEKIRQDQLNKLRPALISRDGGIGNQNNMTGTLQHIISGADLSVFLMAEIPSLDDIQSGNGSSLLAKKELILIELDSVMSLGYSIVREVFPVRTLGKSKPIGFTRGGISLAGHIAFAIFTDDVLVHMRTQMQKSISDLAVKTERIVKEYTAANNNKINSGLPSDVGNATAAIDSRNRAVELKNQYDAYNKLLNVGNVYMLNQLLPFHLLVMGTNEQGNFSKMMIKGVRIIDENQMQGVSQPNIMNKVTFAAEDIFPMVTGNTTSTGEFTETSVNDLDNISSSKFGIYTGSQIMKDVATMQSGNYRLQG